MKPIRTLIVDDEALARRRIRELLQSRSDSEIVGECANGEEAVAYDNLCEGHRQAVPEGLLIEGDIRDTEALARALRDFGADAVMHFAAATYVGESVDNPEYHYDNNINGTRSLLNAMRAAGVQRMLFSSTCATYGLNPKMPMTEESAQDPCSPYGRTKLAVEWMIRSRSRWYSVR